MITYLSMQLTTVIDIPKSSFKIKESEKILFLGSCFADSVGEKFMRGGFDALVNPFGTLYNPMSIAELIIRCIVKSDKDYYDNDVFMSDDGVWHSWMHHSKFSSTSRETLVDNINNTSDKVHDFLKTCNVLVITFGTSIIYRKKDNNQLVANCHKQLDSMFIRERLTVDSIVDKWKEVIDKLSKINNNLKIVFTVSPIRHKRDGMHVNNISKGILLQAVDTIINNEELSIGESNAMQYFPSYEIMLDELRDYRFYADDMIHPSALAVDYIWQRFQDIYFDKNTQEFVRLKNKEWARSQHKTLIK